mgnify:CR=1 FL=1
MREGRSSGTRPASWLVLVLPAVIGLPFVVIGLVELAKTGRMVAASAMTQGTVVENVWAMPVASAGGTPVAEDSGAVEGRTAYVPRVAFETPPSSGDELEGVLAGMATAARATRS